MTTSRIYRTAENWYPMDSREADYLTVDYTDMLDTGETLSSSTVTCEVFSGEDATPSSRLSGSPEISSSRVRQLFEPSEAYVGYLVTFTTVTSTGRTLVIAGKLAVVKES